MLLLLHHQGAHRAVEKPVKGEEGDKPPINETPQKRKGNKIHLDDAEGSVA